MKRLTIELLLFVLLLGMGLAPLTSMASTETNVRNIILSLNKQPPKNKVKEYLIASDKK